MPATSDYARVERAIHFLQDHQEDQPDLATVARAVGLSEYHFQRLFRRWAGISPKRFLQHLTVQRAKGLMAEPMPLLDVAYDVGLSGPGRLHDLFVSADGVTPGQFRSGGADLTLRHAAVDTRLGRCLLARTDAGICWLQFVDDDAVGLADLQRAWPKAQLRRDVAGTKQVLSRIFPNDNTGPDSKLVLHLRGTNFQLKVWQALLAIPAGQVTSYAAIAEAIGQPTASRAVGTAVGRNDIAVLIPCHRVIRGDGALGGYRWGTTRKIALQATERAHA